MRVSSSATYRAHSLNSFVMHLMLQSRPEILCNCADLNLYFGINDTVGEKDRCGNQHMITAVTALFRIFHIITSCKDRQVILFGNHICDQIDIRCKGTADTDSCDVIYIAYHVLDTGFISMSFQFFFWILHVRLDCIYVCAEIHRLEYQSLFLPV